MALAYVENVIDAMLAAANSEVRTGSVYNVVDCDVNQGEVARALREVTQGYIQPIFVPYIVVWSMMAGIDLLSLFRENKLGTARYRLARWLANMRFPCTAAREELNWKPRVSLMDALARTVGSSPDFPRNAPGPPMTTRLARPLPVTAAASVADVEQIESSRAGI